MKTLQKIIAIAALSGCINNSEPKPTSMPYVPTPSTTVPRCWAPDAYIGLLNEEVSEALYNYVAVPMCSDVVYDIAASGRYAVVNSPIGPIYLDPATVNLPVDTMYSMLAHEYGHVFYQHPAQRAYIDFVSGYDPCADAAAVRDMELQSDMLSGVLTAVAGRPYEPFVDFVNAMPENPWMPLCMQQYYPKSERIDAFMQSYNAAKAMGF